MHTRGRWVGNLRRRWLTGDARLRSELRAAAHHADRSLQVHLHAEVEVALGVATQDGGELDARDAGAAFGVEELVQRRPIGQITRHALDAAVRADRRRELLVERKHVEQDDLLKRQRLGSAHVELGLLHEALA